MQTSLVTGPAGSEYVTVLEKEYRMLHETIKESLVVVDLELQIQFFNQQFCELTGYAPHELQGQPIAMLIDQGRDQQKIALEAKLRKQGIGGQYELRVRTKTGRLLWVSVNSSPIKDDQGNIIGSISTHLDITDKIEAQRALQLSEERYKSLFEQNPDPVCSLNHKGQICSANAAFAQMAGRCLQELHNICLSDILEEECRESYHNCFRKVLERTPQTFLTVLVLPDNMRLVMNITQMPIVVNGEIEGVFCILKDETGIFNVTQELKQSHQELRELASHIHVAREEERKRIAREIHDELGQVLTALKIDLTLLARKTATVSNEIALEMDLTSKIADEAIRSVKRIVTELRPIGIDELGLMKEVKLYAQRFQSRYRIEVELQTGTDRLQINREKAIEVYRIIQEALTNVARHSEADKVIIGVKQQGRQLQVEVRDNGIGIQKGADKSNKSFGLIGMRERAHMIGGKLTVSSEKGEGTRIELRLPLDY